VGAQKQQEGWIGETDRQTIMRAMKHQSVSTSVNGQCHFCAVSTHGQGQMMPRWRLISEPWHLPLSGLLGYTTTKTPRCTMQYKKKEQEGINQIATSESVS
jgi:hypothetical protein